VALALTLAKRPRVLLLDEPAATSRCLRCWAAACQAASQISSTLACMARLGYRSFTTYQPGYRFWPFQFIETGIFVALAAALIGVTFFVVRRRDA
jgi:hypothetical protein